MAGQSIDISQGTAPDMSGYMGFHIGGAVELPLSDNAKLETGLFYSVRGSKQEETISNSGIDASYSATTKISYLDIPVNFKYKFGTGNINVFAKGGGYFGYALSGVVDAETSFTIFGQSQSQSLSSDLDFGGGDDEVAPMDYGLALGAGVELTKFTVGLTYNFGLADLSNNSDFTTKNRFLMISLGYRIFGS